MGKLSSKSDVPSYPGARLVQFVERDMRMSSYYQPLIIKELVQASGNRLSADDLARSLLREDTIEVERARDRLMRWPYQTLQDRRKIVAYDKSTGEFVLPVEFASDEEKAKVLDICDRALKGWRQKEKPPTTKESVHYTVYERAGGRCQACGRPGRFGQLDIDHIVPRDRVDRHGEVKLHGERLKVDDEGNLQVLCRRCNRAKRDTGDTDFRPRQDWLVDSIANVLRLAKDQDCDVAEVLRAAKQRFDKYPEMPVDHHHSFFSRTPAKANKRSARRTATH